MTKKLKATWARQQTAAEKLNGLPADATAETRATVEAEFNTASAELRAALEAEPSSPVAPAGGPETPGLTEYLRPFSRGERLEGRALEYAQHHGLNDHSLIPPEIIFGQPEHRADVATAAPTNAGTQVFPVAPRVFYQSVASRVLGVQMPSAVGAALFPILTGGTTPATAAKGGVVDAAAGTFTVRTLKPKRISGRYVIGIEDLAEFPQAEESLRADLRGVAFELLDSQIIAGNGSAPNFDGILNHLTDPDAPTTKAGWQDFVDAVVDGIDGKYAPDLASITLLLGVASYKLAAKQTARGDSTTPPPALPSPVLNFLSREYRANIFSSGHIPAPTNTVQAAIRVGEMAKSYAIAPQWGVEVLRDPYSLASRGQVALQLHILADFDLKSTDGWAQVAFKLGT